MTVVGHLQGAFPVSKSTSRPGPSATARLDVPGKERFAKKTKIAEFGEVPAKTEGEQHKPGGCAFLMETKGPMETKC